MTKGPPAGIRLRAHKGKGPQRGRPRRRSPTDQDSEVQIFGLHAVEAALNNAQRAVHRLMITENAERRIADAVRARGIDSERVMPRDLDKLLGADTVHQGVLLICEPITNADLAELVCNAETGRPIVILDQVTDPHNVGAILRSAAAFDSGGLVLTRRHSPPLSGALAKSASGALELVPIALVPNLARAIQHFKDAGVAVVGLDEQSPNALETSDFRDPVAFVLGAEGKGLRKLTTETCTSLCRISTRGEISSLNVSNAAAIILHHYAQRRHDPS